jgi:hypothetical protein
MAGGVMTIVLLIVFFLLLPNLPAYWVFRKAGWSGWWFLALFVPLVGLIVLWAFAFRRWPSDDALTSQGSRIDLGWPPSR